jgi:hypothetical protein
MIDLYEAYVVSSIQTSLLRTGFNVQREVTVDNHRYDVIAKKQDPHREKPTVFVIEFKKSDRKPASKAPRKMRYGAESVDVHFAFINSKKKQVSVDDSLAKVLRQAASDLDLIVTSEA